jgi:hypothetical protein
MNRLLAAAALAFALAACATPKTVYAPAATAEAAGYREQRIEADRYRITFRGNPDLKAQGVEDLALRRAAEVTTQNGGDWFRVVTRSTDLVGGQRAGGTSVGVGGSSGSFGSSVGVGIGINLSPDTRRYETRMEILIGRGAKPANDVDAYDARAILSRPA